MAPAESKFKGSPGVAEKLKKAIVGDGAAGRSHKLKKYTLQTGIIYGPVQSRRLGISLGINLLPTEYKLCSFNCIYCQYGWTKKGTLAPADSLNDLPSVEQITAAVESALQQLAADGKTIDSMTICGNGEPTLYPNLAAIFDGTKRLRDRYQPAARLTILSNSSTVGRKDVRDALDMLDLKIMKFDAGSEELFRQLNHPRGPIYMGDIVDGLKQLTNIFLQCLFVQGRVTNADPDSVALWVERVHDIHPLGVQVYTLDREPADKRIEKVSLATLQWIADQVQWHGGVSAEIY